MEMKFLQALTQVRQGIENNNMTQVAAGYEAMTGEAVKPKKAKRGRKPKAEETVPAQGVPDSGEVVTYEPEVEFVPPPVVRHVPEGYSSGPVNTNVYGTPLQNQFNPEEFQSAKQTGEDRIKDNLIPPVPRRRPPAQKRDEDAVIEIGLTG